MCNKNCQVLVKNLNFVAGMTRRFVSPKRLIRSFSNSSKLVEYRAQSLVREVKQSVALSQKDSQPQVHEFICNKNCQVLVKNLTFVVGMTRRFVSAKRLIRYCSPSAIEGQTANILTSRTVLWVRCSTSFLEFEKYLMSLLAETKGGVIPATQNLNSLYVIWITKIRKLFKVG